MDRPNGNSRAGPMAGIARIVIGVLMLVVVVSGTAISLGTADLLQTVADEWHGQRKLSEHKGQMLAKIRRHMGYGGMIHHFKNFVLRKDPALLGEIQSDLTELNATFAEMAKSSLTGDEVDALGKLQQIVDQYALNLSIAIQASREKWPAEQTDAQVRIDDQPAYKALQILQNTWFAKFNEDTQRFEAVIAEGIYGLRITTAFIPLLVISGFVILWFTQRLTREIAIRKQAEHKLLLAETVFDSISEAAMVTDDANNIIAVNPAFSDITGYSSDEVIGKNPRMFASGQHDATFYQDMWRDLSGDGSWQGVIWNRRRSGQIYPERLSIVKAPVS
ncbi:MAG: PAS domain S-box protein [Rhodospirillaceae bacterium]|nr:PAS domain S-box protein [Rhodospirillaceae bacterium]